MNRVTAVFYDLDNTLYPQLEDIGQRIDYCAMQFSLPNAGEIKYFYMEEWSENGPLKRDLLDRVIEKFSLNVNKEKLISAFRSCETSLLLGRETRRLLRRIKGMGIKQFLITNGNLAIQRNKIQSLGIEELFDEILIARGEYSKPSNHWFRELVKKYNLNPDDCLSVGDWYAVDGIASLSAGILFLHKKGGPVKEDVPEDVPVITELKEIEEYMIYAHR